MDRDEVAFIADQLGEARAALASADNDRAARLLLALEAEAPESGVVDELIMTAAERLAKQAKTGDEQARAALLDLLRKVAG